MRLFGYELSLKRPSTDGRRVIPTDLDSMWLGAGFGTMQPQDFGALVRAYKSWIYMCANKNATSVAQVPLRLYVAKPERGMKLIIPTKPIRKETSDFLRSSPGLANLDQVKKAVEIEEVLEHPFIDLMRNVNNFANRFDLWESTELFQELTGNAYWYVIANNFGVPSELWVLPSDRMRVVPGKGSEEFVKGYVYQVGTRMVKFDESEIIHFKFASSTSMFYGTGPLAAAAQDFNISENMDAFEAALFKNMGVPAGFLETDKKITDDEFKSWKTRWNETYGGVKRQGKMGFLDLGLKFKSAQMTPKEMSFVIGRKLTKEKICNIFGQSLGMYDANATRANSEMASYMFMRDTVRPRLLRIEEKLNEKVTPRYDKRLFVAFDNPVPEDQDRVLKARETHLKNGVTTINEERAKLGMESVEWGETPYQMPKAKEPIEASKPD